MADERLHRRTQIDQRQITDGERVAVSLLVIHNPPSRTQPVGRSSPQHRLVIAVTTD